MRIPLMARGFESKGVESQQSETRLRHRSAAESREFSDQRERDSKRASLETSRRRIARELEASRSDTHRAALKNALSFLDAELRKLV